MRSSPAFRNSSKGFEQRTTSGAGYRYWWIQHGDENRSSHPQLHIPRAKAAEIVNSGVLWLGGVMEKGSDGQLAKVSAIAALPEFSEFCEKPRPDPGRWSNIEISINVTDSPAAEVASRIAGVLKAMSSAYFEDAAES